MNNIEQNRDSQDSHAGTLADLIIMFLWVGTLVLSFIIIGALVLRKRNIAISVYYTLLSYEFLSQIVQFLSHRDRTDTQLFSLSYLALFTAALLLSTPPIPNIPFPQPVAMVLIGCSVLLFQFVKTKVNTDTDDLGSDNAE